jgi:hypothetical protein
MTCRICEGMGLVRLCYKDDPQPMDTFDVAICLCPEGQRMRRARNGGRATGYPLWKVWAARAGFDESRVIKIEDEYGPDDLKRMFPRGFGLRSEVDDITTAGITRRPRL